MIDYTGITSSECPNCGDKKFKTWVAVDNSNFALALYGTDGECWECGTKYSLVTPSDYIEDTKGKIE